MLKVLHTVYHTDLLTSKEKKSMSWTLFQSQFFSLHSTNPVSNERAGNQSGKSQVHAGKRWTEWTESATCHSWMGSPFKTHVQRIFNSSLDGRTSQSYRLFGTVSHARRTTCWLCENYVLCLHLIKHVSAQICITVALSFAVEASSRCACLRAYWSLQSNSVQNTASCNFFFVIGCNTRWPTRHWNVFVCLLRVKVSW